MEWIALGKRNGLSLSEMNELRVCDLTAYLAIHLDVREPAARQATQADIDGMLG